MVVLKGALPSLLYQFHHFLARLLVLESKTERKSKKPEKASQPNHRHKKADHNTFLKKPPRGNHARRSLTRREKLQSRLNKQRFKSRSSILSYSLPLVLCANIHGSNHGACRFVSRTSRWLAESATPEALGIGSKESYRATSCAEKS